MSCGDDAPQFKGIFMKNLAYLNKASPNPKYKRFITENARSIVWQSRNHLNQFGFSWAEEFDIADAARQSAALDTLNAAFSLSNQRRAESDQHQEAMAGSIENDLLISDQDEQTTFNTSATRFDHSNLVLTNAFKDVR
ncbi:MAG: hypothetical protein LH702_32765 [Phormidesmis sp. CAN_BIN44]|nr:hypothetical protein [Phormidesmis sp. CAN_BIN44]